MNFGVANAHAGIGQEDGHRGEVETSRKCQCGSVHMCSELYLPASMDSKIRRNDGRCDWDYMELLRDVTIVYTYWFIPPPPE